MFWKKKEETQQQTTEKPAAAAEKPCCSGKEKTGEAEQTAPQQQQQPAGIATFEFKGTADSSIKLVGHCQGTDPNAIQACQWRPSADPKHTILF